MKSTTQPSWHKLELQAQKAFWTAHGPLVAVHRNPTGAVAQDDELEQPERKTGPGRPHRPTPSQVLPVMHGWPVEQAVPAAANVVTQLPLPLQALWVHVVLWPQAVPIVAVVALLQSPVAGSQVPGTWH